MDPVRHLKTGTPGKRRCFLNAVEILIIGNEVLAGNVLDTNSHWLCQQCASLGAHVRRIAVLPDEPEQIADGVRSALSRAPRLILTSGGLGPTRDDLTVGAIADALGLPVAANPLAYGMIKEFYGQLHARGEVTTAEMLPARAKMARMPAGAEPLRNRTGAAPGVLLGRGETMIVSLPGVPAEMKDIFTNSLLPRLKARFGRQSYGERLVKTNAWDESILAPAVDAVASRHPGVYVKSRAQVYGGGVEDFVTLAARGADEAEVNALLDSAEKDLRDALHGIGVETS